MNPDLQKQLLVYLQEIAGAIKAGGQFALDQAPLVVQEQLLYARCGYTALSVLLLTILAAAVAFAYGCIRDDDDDGLGFFALLLAFMALVANVAAASMTLKVWLAPRVYIIEWIRGLL